MLSDGEAVIASPKGGTGGVVMGVPPGGAAMQNHVHCHLCHFRHHLGHG